MPTQDQIEAVARAIWEAYEGKVAGVHFDDPIVKGNAFREGKAINQAKAAIAAYEATRPAVFAVTDGLISAIIEAAKPNPIDAYTMGTPRDRVRAVLEAPYWIAPAVYDTEGE
jgi:2-methylisocitrate lyase-like PEP mutase family enzyme